MTRARANRLKVWRALRPHFGGQGGHRYERVGNRKICVYCARPRDWVDPLKKADHDR